MNQNLVQLSAIARKAVSSNAWATVDACAKEILRHDSLSAEGHFLSGLVSKASGQRADAVGAFAKALDLDADRHDAAIELAHQYSIDRRNADAAALTARYEDKLNNSPLYLNLAGTIYSDIGMPEVLASASEGK